MALRYALWVIKTVRILLRLLAWSGWSVRQQQEHTSQPCATAPDVSRGNRSGMLPMTTTHLQCTLDK